MLTLYEYPLHETVMQFFENAERNGFQRRDGQIEMAEEISRAIIEKKILAVEAGVGIGKSFAYLVPALIQYFRERRQIIIATSTIALQEQLERDTKTILRMLGVQAPVTLAKGMTNYACMRRVHALLRKYPEDAFLRQLQGFIRNGKQDKAHIHLNIRDDEWEKTAIQHFGGRFCQNCGYLGECVYRQIRSRIDAGNNIVICNQNMMVSHFVNEKRIFSSNIGTIIIDEAHHLEGIFRDVCTESYSQNEMLQAVRNCARTSHARNSGRIAESLQSDILHLFRTFRDQIKVQKRDELETISFHMQSTKDVITLMKNIRKNAAALENTDELSVLYSFLHQATTEADKHILWLTKRPEIRLNICRRDLRKIIGTLLYQPNRTTVLTSATLSSGYYLNTICFPDNGIIAEPKPSPFDYEHHTIMYLSKNLPCPTKENRKKYLNTAIPEIVRLLEITHGKALILFTAKQDLDAVYKRLSNMHLTYKLIRQSPVSSQEHQLERFRTDTNSVILGTGIYWEGINVEGDALSQVIIYRLPFPVPDPILKYKMSLAENPIKDVIVPEMLIKLRQGTGRLIRSDTDTGIISILDPRARSKRYSVIIRDALPFKNIAENIEDAQRFWGRLHSEGDG